MNEKKEIEWIVAAEEMQTPRRASEMGDWLAKMSDRFGSLPAEKIEAVRLRQLGAKHYFGEAVPIARFAIEYFQSSPAVTIEHVLGNQQFDARVTDTRDPPGPVKFIEVTESVDGASEALRMEKLNREGSTPAYGRIESDGPRHRRGAIRAESIAHSHNALREAELARIREVVTAKAAKQYPEGTALVVLADDMLPLRDDEDIQALDEFANAHLLPISKQFVVLAVVGGRRLYRVYAPNPTE